MLQDHQYLYSLKPVSPAAGMFPTDRRNKLDNSVLLRIPELKSVI